MEQKTDYQDFERKVILSKGLGSKYEKNFFLEIQSLILEGWRIVDSGLREDSCMRNYKGNMGKAVLYKMPEGTVEKLEGMTPLQELITFKKKKPMMDLAEKHGIEVPDDVKNPSAIKKYLQEKLEESTSDS